MLHQARHSTGFPGVPRQLPRTPGVFVGRDTVLADLDLVCAERDGRCGLALITGPPGMGKSALAVFWADRASDGFPDGQLFVDLGATSHAGPVESGEVLDRFLRALGFGPDEVPAGTAERAALFRSATVHRRLLVVLDNASSAEQVRPLVPSGAGCMVLVTARARLPRLISDGARPVPVAHLDDRAAHEMLARFVGAARIEAD